MKNVILKILFAFLFILFVVDSVAWEGMPMPRLHVEGRYLKDPHGNIVNLHGFAQTYSPWFNGRGEFWDNYDVEGCLDHNKGVIDGVLEAGWKVNFVRLHMDPYWSSTPGCQGRYEGEECFSETRFIKYLDEVFVPMAEYAVSRGLYVVMRPPGVCPDTIAVGDVYNQYLIKVWGIVSQHPKLKNHPNIMYELANEPVDILGTDGTYGANSQGHFDNLKTYFQSVVDTIRASADNILWIPGLRYQSQYQGFAENPIEGENIGYAVHAYPGWFHSGDGYESFQRGWDIQVQPVADFAPIMVTEMDWAPEEYNASWGKGITGTAGGEGFGANFKKIADECGNVSWLIFTWPEELAEFTGVPPADGEDYTFLNDPEACPWPTYHWFQEYAQDYAARQDFEYRSISDNGDGTFSNPVIAGDFPASIIVSNDNTFYIISVNPDIVPDTTILKSKDLVNWEYCDEPLKSIPLGKIMPVNDSDISAGTLVETVAGEWWALVNYEMGPFGIFPHLLPVTWTDGIPVPDETFKDAVNLPKPDVGRDHIPTSLVTNDNFRHYILGLQWGWNGNPDDENWSLMERAGYMRLRTVDVTNDLHEAQNILTQRMLAYPSDPEHSFGTIRMEFENMLDGDVAGLSVFQDNFSYIGVAMVNGEKQLVVFTSNELQEGPPVEGAEIYLRIISSYETGNAGFYYSFDNATYTKLGDDITMDITPSKGSRFGIFNYATLTTGGYVDIDWFSTESDFSENKFYTGHFEGYTEESLTLSDIIVEEGETITLLTSSSKRIKVTAVYADGHTEEIGLEAQYTNQNPDLIAINKGTIRSFIDGEATLIVAYTGPLGHKKEVSANVVSKTFPLTNELFNPNIWENGTFDETTKTLYTGQWGFGGWQYDGIDMSGYKYLVAKLGSTNTSDVDFRLFDGSSYWGSPATYKFGNSRQIVVVLDDSKKDDGTLLNPEHIYIAGFWSNGNNPFVIDTVFLTNSGEYDTPEIFAKDSDGNDIQDLTGFHYIMGAGPSSSQKLTVSGTALTNDIDISLPMSFEASLDTTQVFSSNITLSQTNGQVAETNVFVRLRSGLANSSYQGDLTISSTGALTKRIPLSGTIDQVTGIDDLRESDVTVVLTQYFTLTGQPVRSIEHMNGIFIVRKHMSDGTINTSRIIVWR